MNEDKRAFDKFLKAHSVYKKFYYLLFDQSSRQWREDNEYPSDADWFLEETSQGEWISTAFCWWTNGGDEFWDPLSNEWHDVYYERGKKYYISCKMPKKIKTV